MFGDTNKYLRMTSLKKKGEKKVDQWFRAKEVHLQNFNHQQSIGHVVKLEEVESRFQNEA